MISRIPHMAYPSIHQLKFCFKRIEMWDLQFVVKNVKNQGWYIRSWKWREKSQREHKKWWRNCFICISVLYEYAGTGGRDEKFLANIFLCKNISRTSKIKVHSYCYSLLSYAIVCIYCGIGGHSAHQTNRWSTILSAIGVGKPSRT